MHSPPHPLLHLNLWLCSCLIYGLVLYLVQVYPDLEEFESCLPPCSFLSSSSDNTIRVWSTESPHSNRYSQVPLRSVQAPPNLFQPLSLLTWLKSSCAGLAQDCVCGGDLGLRPDWSGNWREVWTQGFGCESRWSSPSLRWSPWQPQVRGECFHTNFFPLLTWFTPSIDLTQIVLDCFLLTGIF